MKRVLIREILAEDAAKVVSVRNRTKYFTQM